MTNSIVHHFKTQNQTISQLKANEKVMQLQSNLLHVFPQYCPYPFERSDTTS